MFYRHDTTHCLAPEHNALVEKLAPAMEALAAGKHPDATPIIDSASATSDLTAIETLAADIRKRFKTVVVAGSGGSTLCGRALVEFASPATATRFHFLENIDPEAMEALLACLDVATTCFLIISKSGTTVETLSQFYILLEYAQKKLGEKAGGHFFVITLPGSNPMRDAAKEHGISLLDHHSIGGRFSILTNVGLLPAAIAGVDIRALRQGAASVVTQMKNAENPSACWPAIGAAVQCAFIAKGLPINVLLPYAERLKVFALWYRQCWAESLGKRGRGSTPIAAMGTTDQHSQLQLYLDGPHDKLFHMILVNRRGTGPRIPTPARPDLDYLKDKSLGDVMEAEQHATLETLVRHHCPVRVFRLDRLAEEQMGALLMHFMLEIIFAGQLLAVNPFDQPAVEEGKKLAREYLLKNTL